MREVEGQGTGLTEKEKILESVWQLVKRAGVARFPGTRGRIPNFVGAEAAARMLAGLTQWKRATRIKANPDAPQLPVRYQALKDGKTVYMAVPRLREERCFIELDPGKIGASLRSAASIKGAFRYGRPVSPKEVRGVDLIVCGSIAVNREGARVGKGGGFSDLEYALLLEWGAITYDTPIATTVHPLQIIDD